MKKSTILLLSSVWFLGLPAPAQSNEPPSKQIKGRERIAPPVNMPMKQSGPTEITNVPVRLDNADLQQALDFYASIKGRTVLQHPLLKRTTISVVAAGQKAQLEAAFEDAFRAQEMGVIPDGEKFVMIVPASLTNFVTPGSDKIVSTVLGDLSSLMNNQILPAGTINFPGSDVNAVVRIYGEIIGRKLAAGSQRPHGIIRLKTATPLSKAEVIYAFETLFDWQGLRMVPESDKTFRVEPSSQSRSEK